MTPHYPDLPSASDWLKQIPYAARPIRSTTQIWVVTRHQYRIFALVSQTSFRGENGGGVAECRLFSQVRAKETSDAIAHTTNTRKDLINVSLLISSGEKRKLKVTFCLFRTSISFICFLKPAISSFFCFSRCLFSASSCSMRFLSCSPESWERNNKYNKKLQVLKKTFRDSAKPFWCKEFYLHENKKNHFHINGLRQVGNDLLERFSFEYRKTKTKVITLANHKGHRQYSEPIKNRSNYM